MPKDVNKLSTNLQLKSNKSGAEWWIIQIWKLVKKSWSIQVD